MTASRTDAARLQLTASGTFTLALAGVVLLAMSLNEYQLFYQLHEPHAREFVDISNGVLAGHPPWKAFQARLLGPALFAAFDRGMNWLQSAAPGGFSAFQRVFSLPDTRDAVAFDAFFAVLILAKNAVLCAVLHRHTGSLVKAVGGSILGSVLFVMMSDRWIYMWDPLEIILFSVLALFAFRGAAPGLGFFVLFIVSLTNRESAAFFGVWLLLLSASRWLMDGRLAWRDAAIGIAMMVVAVGYVLFLRNHLLVESTLGHETGAAWSGGAPPALSGPHQALGNHLLLVANAMTFLKNLVSTRFYVDAYIVALLVHGGLLARTGWQRRQPVLVALGGFNLFLLASIVTFALINETRLFLITIPFLVFSAVTFTREIGAWLGRVDRQATTR